MHTPCGEHTHTVPKPMHDVAIATPILCYPIDACNRPIYLASLRKRYDKRVGGRPTKRHPIQLNDGNTTISTALQRQPAAA